MSLERIQTMGILVEPAAAAVLEAAEPDLQARAADRLAAMRSKPLIMDAGLAKKLLLPEMRQLKKIRLPEQMTIKEYTAAWSARFAALQQVLLKKYELTNAVSIGGASGSCAVIGQVKKSANMVELEDPTGSIELLTDRQLLDDDVIGVAGFIEGGKLRAKEVLFPDVQMRQPSKGSHLLGINNEADFIIKPEGTEWWDVGGIVVLVHATNWKGEADKLGTEPARFPIELLRRHHLGMPPWDLLEPVPDIFIAFGIAVQPVNYKGTMVIGVEQSAVINLAAPEAERT